MASMLVIDDNAMNLELMIYLLRAFGHDAQGRADSIAGLAAALEGNFDVVLTDVLMPGIDGYEVARRMKSDPRTREVPLIAVTALAMPEDRARIVAGGFDGYIAKPIEPRSFVSQVESYLVRAPD